MLLACLLPAWAGCFPLVCGVVAYERACVSACVYACLWEPCGGGLSALGQVLLLFLARTGSGVVSKPAVSTTVSPHSVF